jgi:CRISPR-associated endonuclease/helicase Cas3
MLPDLVKGQEKMERILREYHDDEDKYDHNLMHPQLIANYFHYYYGEFSDLFLKYKVRKRDNTILDLLSDNAKSEEEYIQAAIQKYGDEAKPLTQFHQSFESAWKEFEVIAQDTIGVIVPFEKGSDIINELYALPDLPRCMELLQEAQQYSVNVYLNEKDNMLEKGMIEKVPLKSDLEIYTVNEKHYDQNMGLTDVEGKMTLINA